MGYFSWKTSDTEESIFNVFSNHFDGRPVYLLQPNGQPAIKESGYEGMGNFGGRDAYELLAEWNGLGSDRGKGFKLSISGDPIKYPLKFSFNPDAVYEDLPAAKNCERQGHF